MATTKRKGRELVSIGVIDTKDEGLLDILKDNGFYLEKKKLERFDREHYIILAEVEG